MTNAAYEPAPRDRVSERSTGVVALPEKLSESEYRGRTPIMITWESLSDFAQALG